jgi:hypothetical protein
MKLYSCIVHFLLRHAHTQEISYINSFIFEILFKLSSLIGVSLSRISVLDLSALCQITHFVCIDLLLMRIADQEWYFINASLEFSNSLRPCLDAYVSTSIHEFKFHPNTHGLRWIHGHPNKPKFSSRMNLILNLCLCTSSCTNFRT